MTEDRLAAEGAHDVTDDAEARDDHEVDLWVAKEPEEVLVKHRVLSVLGVLRALLIMGVT